MKNKERYLQPVQAQTRPSTSYEDLLGDAMERAFSQGIHDLSGLVAYLNKSGPLSSTGAPWTEDSYKKEIKELAQSA